MATMMFEQAAVSSSSLRLRNNLPMIPQNPNSIPKTQCPMGRKTQQRGLRLKLKCSFSPETEEMRTYPKPSEIKWKKELSNSVNLIGTVAVPVEIRHFPSGKVAAWTRITIKKNATQNSWINLTFWDELAHVAFQHVKEGHRIYVSGRLVTDTVETDNGTHQSYYKVVCDQLNFVDTSFSLKSSHDLDSDSMMPGRKMSYASNNTSSVVESWQAFFANPGEWWDNRQKKRNPRGPDFKHKDTGEALWIEGRYTPTWVRPQLEILDTRMGSPAGHNDRMPVHMMNADEILSF